MRTPFDAYESAKTTRREGAVYSHAPRHQQSVFFTMANDDKGTCLPGRPSKIKQ
jgi:hypothetical protein